MGAARHQPPALHHQDAIRPPDRRQPMRDHQRRPPPRQRRQGELHRPLALRIQRRGRLIQQQDRRIAQNRPRDRHTLPLPARQPHPLLAQERVEPLGQLGEEPGMRRHRRRPHLGVRRIGAPIADILPAIGAEDHRVLRHHPDQPAQRRQLHRGDIHPVDQNPPRGGIVEPLQQLKDRRLPRARRPHQRHRLPRRDLSRKRVQRGGVRPRRIAETHPLEANLAAHHRREPLRPRRRGDQRPLVQDLQQPPRRPRRPLHIPQQLAQRRPRGRHDHRIEHEGRQLPPAHPPANHIAPAHPQAEGDRPEPQRDHAQQQQRPRPHPPQRGGDRRLHRGGKPHPIHRLMGE